MDDYVITFARSARRELQTLDSSIVNRIFTRIQALSKEPRPRGYRKLRGEENLWRIRIGEYRVIYSINDEERIVDISTIRHRSDAYR